MIFYFSGTGNTKWAAERLAEVTNERLLFIPDELKGECRYELSEGERIGFCFPVHGWQPPKIVRQFIAKMQLSKNNGHYAYALCTCGDSAGRAMDMLGKLLSDKQITLQVTLSLIMPESYVCLPFMYTDTPEREQAKISQAAQELEPFCRLVEQRQSGFSQIVRGALPYTYSHVIGAYFNRFMISDKKFTVDAEVCLHCGKCAEVCPTGNIELTDLPSWKNDNSCTCCLSCYHHCSVHAINYGRITRRRKQYYFGH